MRICREQAEHGQNVDEVAAKVQAQHKARYAILGVGHALEAGVIVEQHLAALDGAVAHRQIGFILGRLHCRRAHGLLSLRYAHFACAQHV